MMGEDQVGEDNHSPRVEELEEFDMGDMGSENGSSSSSESDSVPTKYFYNDISSTAKSAFVVKLNPYVKKRLPR